MKNAIAALVVVVGLLAASCATGPSPSPPAEEPEIVTSPEPEPEEVEIGSASVTASTLNVRTGPGAEESSIASLKKGERVAVIRKDGSWTRVRLQSGIRGWVASKYLKQEKGCPPDRDFRFVKAPVPSFSEAQAKGVVVVEVLVDTRGKVVSTKVTENSTGDDALAQSVVSEIRGASFDPPVRRCVPKKFVYVYRRTF